MLALHSLRSRLAFRVSHSAETSHPPLVAALLGLLVTSALEGTTRKNRQIDRTAAVFWASSVPCTPDLPLFFSVASGVSACEFATIHHDIVLVYGFSEHVRYSGCDLPRAL